jgi:hypothetical protein
MEGRMPVGFIKCLALKDTGLFMCVYEGVSNDHLVEAWDIWGSLCWGGP